MANELSNMNEAIKATTIKTGKYLTFTLADEDYGIGILKVKEIIGMMLNVGQKKEYRTSKRF